MKVLGIYLREKRKELGLSIQNMADNLGIAYSTAANIEAGSKKPTLEQLERYGVTLGCDWTDILKNIMDDAKFYYNELTSKVDTTVINKNDDSSIRSAKYYIKDIEQFTKYCTEIQEEYKEKKAAENLKINNDVEAVIKIFVDRWTTKDSAPVNQKDITDFRDELIKLIELRAQHLTSK